MKSFLEEYGIVIVVAVIIIALIVVARWFASSGTDNIKSMLNQFVNSANNGTNTVTGVSN